MALNSQTEGEATLYDVGRYEVRPMIMSNPGAVAPVVYGGKVRAVMLYLDRDKMQARGLSPLDVMKAMDNYNVFLPGRRRQVRRDRLRHRLELDVRPRRADGRHAAPDRARQRGLHPRRGHAQGRPFIQTNIVRVDGRKQVYIPVFRQLGASTLSVIDSVKRASPT